ncbi:unnamed protein product [[Candida] boidinii]|uniref:Unnamed protein product n=1 Tax=Candida boidinii TaxID=5477 RepID=A0A9W6SUX8_CANBO|nr:hypothetical protein B5S30_g4586 [[Candida] boidinii]GME66910.1 unnamed protein product [[Candida] boidinii]GMF98490.1 unnamed protein product [[Candida] boidinii]
MESHSEGLSNSKEIEGYDLQQFHKREFQTHENILKYSNFNKLLIYLSNTLYSDLPRIKYPSIETFSDILTVTTISDHNTSSISEINDEGYLKRQIHLRSLDFMLVCTKCFDDTTNSEPQLGNNDSKDIGHLFEEVDLSVDDKKELKSILKTVFKFLKPQVNSLDLLLSPQKKKRSQVIDFTDKIFKRSKSDESDLVEKQDSIYQQETEDAMTELDNESLLDNTLDVIDFDDKQKSSISSELLKSNNSHDYNESLLGHQPFFKLINRKPKNNNTWRYFKWGFKCSSLQYTKPIYRVNWLMWKSILNLFLQLMYFDLENIMKILNESEFKLNQKRAMLKKSIFSLSLRDLNEFSTEKAVEELTSLAFFTYIDGGDVKQVFATDLKRLKSFVPVEYFSSSSHIDSFREDKDQEVIYGLDSIQIRKKLLILMHLFASEFYISSADSHKIIDILTNRTSEHLVSRCSYAEFVEFFTSYATKDISKNELAFTYRVANICLQTMTCCLEDIFEGMPLFDTLKENPKIDKFRYLKDLLQFQETAYPDYLTIFSVGVSSKEPKNSEGNYKRELEGVNRVSFLFQHLIDSWIFYHLQCLDSFAQTTYLREISNSFKIGDEFRRQKFIKNYDTDSANDVICIQPLFEFKYL